MIQKFIFIFFANVICLTSQAQYHMEYLSRGVVAVKSAPDKAFISWRLLGNESPATTFNVYRQMNGQIKKLNATPVTSETCFVDSTLTAGIDIVYTVKAVNSSREEKGGESYQLLPDAKNYVSIPLQLPDGYHANDASVGDMDGDGNYEIVIHCVGKGKDNSQAGVTTVPIFQCYTLQGKKLWEINLGKNIREGAHYTQFMVYDLDGDGRAEVAMKTADGTIDGKGKVIGDSTKDYRNEKGYILAGPEYLTVFDGLTGGERSTVLYNPPRHPNNEFPSTQELKSIWGDGYGNRMDRFLACIAYLDGSHPSLVMCRGYYTRTVLAAWDFKNGKLEKRWVFDSNDKGNSSYAGQGNHNLTVTDVDGDGKDEIVYGQMTIDDNGKGLYTTGIGHADALHVSDLDPSRPGIEVFGIQERFDDAGANFRDAKTGEVIWKKPSIKAGEDGEGPGRACALDIDPRYPGFECWVAGAGITGLFNCKGDKIAERTPPCNMGIYWDADALSEILNGVFIGKWNYDSSKLETLFDARREGCASNNGTKANPCLSADILGDWREELICRTADNKELRIYTTTIPTTIKLYTLMHNPQYRLSIAWQNVAYNQPPHVSYYLGDGMKLPPQPNIIVTKKK